VRALEVRPAVPLGFVDCAGAPRAAVPAAGAPWASRFGVAAVDAARALLPAGLKGVPLPGQKEITEVDALRAAAAASGGGADSEETRALLRDAAARAAAEDAKSKTWFDTLRGWLPMIVIAFVINNFMSSIKGGGGGAAAGGGAAGGGGAAAAATARK
jgi:hypothetical protein